MEKINYATALEELEQIVADIEGANITVDELSDKVKRASVLIKICNEKLKNTENEVNDILKSMEIQKD